MIRPGILRAAGADAVFLVDHSGQQCVVFAAYLGEGEWSQWGASREVLEANVPIVEAWAAAKALQEAGGMSSC